MGACRGTAVIGKLKPRQQADSTANYHPCYAAAPRQTKGVRMGWIALVVVVAVIMYIVMQRGSKGPSLEPSSPASPRAPSGAVPSPEQRLREDIAFLITQWRIADKEKEAGEVKSFPHWYFDAPTARQLDRLSAEGIQVSGGDLTKGAASDLIGLTQPLDEESAEVLKFFKVATRDLNQTRGRYEAKRLMADTTNAASWEARPADAMQKEGLKFFGLPVTRSLSHKDAEKLLDDHRTTLFETNNKRAEAWDQFVSLVEELNDKETREDLGLKKPTLAAIRGAFEAMLAEGMPADECDVDLVAEKLLELKPELAR